jgi:hypothetical protein
MDCVQNNLNFVCNLFTDAITNSDYMASNGWMIMNHRSEWLRKEMVVS